MVGKYLVNGVWAEVSLYCGNHNEPIEMTIQKGPFSLFYACPKYFSENRAEGEHICANRLNLVDFEKMLDHINEILCTEAMDNNNVNLKNHSWKYKGIEIKILVHNTDKICVQCINRPALNSIQR